MKLHFFESFFGSFLCRKGFEIFLLGRFGGLETALEPGSGCLCSLNPRFCT